MNLDDIGNVAELISAIAVLATLIYLSIQIRQNRQVLSSQTLLVAIQNFNEINQGIVADADVARIWATGSANPEALSEGDATRFFMLARQVVNAYMALFWLYRDGVLSEARWKGFGFDLVAGLPGIRRYFDDQAPIMEADFVSYVRATSVPSEWNGVAFVRKGKIESAA
jgi:hypothetical protein